MALTLSAGVRALIDGKNFATVATLDPDGAPQTARRSATCGATRA